MLENYPYQSVKGTRDFFPDQTRRLQIIEQKARELFARFGCGEIRTPILEHTVLFERGVGQGTDIVNKEMFYVPAKDQENLQSIENNRKMVLRPEATASVARAYVEHEIDKAAPGVQKYYYMGPMFRYERPQRGRLRQFTQIGLEVLGTMAPAMDAEAIIVLHDLLAETGIENLVFQLNSVGCSICRPGYITELKAFAVARQSSLCLDCQNRVARNPLRLFDCKLPQCREVFLHAPLIQDSLCPDCQTHQATVTALLGKTKIEFTLVPQLVRGLDYYTRTVFEVTSKALGSQNAVAAGGRYDRLVEELGGPATPAIGWSVGLERLLECLPETPALEPLFDFYVIAPGLDVENTFLQVNALRRQGWRVGLEHEPKSVKALMKRADKLGVRFALFVSETNPDQVDVKNLQTGEQQATSWHALEHWGDSEKA